MPRRVVITGCGVVSAAGVELQPFWTELMSGSCFIRPLANFKAPGMEGLVGAEVTLPPEDDLPVGVDGNGYRSRAAQLALAAARRALGDARLGGDGDGLNHVGIVLGSTLAEERQIGDLSDRWTAQGADAIDADLLRRCDSQRLPALVAQRHRLGGPVVFSATACSSGNAAIAAAYDLVASGAAPAMLAGGTDSLTRLIYCGFQRMGALSKGICAPFDKRRDGVSFGEGSGVVVLEELEHARRRGARIYAELAGYGITNDAHHITAPEPSGSGFARSMKAALAASATTSEEVSYVSAHGTGTPFNDLGEAQAIRAVFGDRAGRVPISSVKSMIGHTNGAASAIEAVVCALAILHQAVPPTANVTEPDPPDLDYVPGKGRAMRVSTCLNLAAGFGGSNVCTVLKRLP